MKTLTLLRHAKSSWADPGARDFDRPLNQRGRDAALAIGREMRAMGLAFDAIITSPAARAVETLAEAGKSYGGSLDAREDERVYLAPPSTLLKIVAETDDSIARLLLVGHNPGLELLAALLTDGDESQARADMANKYPTGALAEITLPVDHWKDVEPGQGRLVRFIKPRDLVG
jgi:phosphohistidine phosphatase